MNCRFIKVLTKSLIILCWLFPQAVLSQAPDTLWMRLIGGPNVDAAYSAVQTSDGGHVIVGYTYAHPDSNSELYVVRTDSYGVVDWEKIYGGSGDNWANSVDETSDGGYIIAGGTTSSGGEDSDIYLLKIDTAGRIIWESTIGGEFDEDALSVCQTSDGGYIMTGWTNSFGAGEDDVYIVKTDSEGDTLWTKTFGYIFCDKAMSIIETTDGCYAAIGGTGYWGYYPTNAYLIKLDADGDSLWTRTYGGSWSDAGGAIIEASDGGYIFLGWTLSFNVEGHDFYLVKVDSSGEQEFYRTYGGNEMDVGRSISLTSDGGYLLTGYTYSFGGWMDIYVIRTDSLGDTLWTDVIGGAGYDQGCFGYQCYDGGYIVGGSTQSFNARECDILLAKYASDQTAIDRDIEFIAANEYSLYQNYPNPFNETTTISFSINTNRHVSLKVYDLLGREAASLFDEDLPAGLYKTSVNASALASGIYIYSLQIDDYRESKMMTLLK
ncbi:MAG: T9SS type A sorting domain-containing protein [candidate division Zixibacteria bacterium]|nr:T9SS type A sorting domain-containing protein [candidate division Zixibacteria bacterium]